ncbi:MAG: ElyC/SanA/YdcF family protein [Propionibacteriaceae bacterium]|nr:ElyC/SanA/YdcF family protein [Propionibacteriaceae bacterium]
MSEKPPRRRRLEIAVAAASLALLGPILVGVAHAAWSSSGRVYGAGDDVPARDVLLVLGAHAHPGRPSRFLQARLDLAVELFNSGKGRAIIVSGANTKASNHETQVMEDYLVSRGIPRSKIVQDGAGFDTYDSCIRARDVYGVRELTLVSQMYHVQRAVATCRALGVDAIAVGDVTARQWAATHLKGELREYLAVVKMELDLLRGAKATHSDPTDAVQVALNS